MSEPAPAGAATAEAPLDLAGRALAAVRSGDGAQATVTCERSLLLRFARSRPTQATSIDDLTVALSVLREGHVATAATNHADGGALEACARAAERAAESAARAASGRGAYPGLGPPARTRAHHGHDPETARLDPTAGGGAVAAAVQACEERGVEANGAWTVGEVATAIASSDGLAATDRVTDAMLKVTAIAPGGRSGCTAGAAVAAGGIDARAIAARAAAKAAAPGEPARLGPGEYPVVLEPLAVGELLGWVGALALNGLAYAEGRSALVGRLGTRVAASTVNLSDSPRYPATLPRAFDAEGVPKAPMPLIQDGVAHAVVHDRRSAALAGGGAASTGHALAPGGAPQGPQPTNLVLVGGGAVDEAELCAPIERGVYVTRLWYTNAVRPRETLITGMTRDGTFLIEDGEITRPLADLRLTDRALGVLEHTEALTADAVLTAGGVFYGRRFASGVVCPALRASALRFTG